MLTLESEQTALTAALANERHVAHDARLALATTAADRATVLLTVGHERTLLASVRGKLATLVREEEIAAQLARARAEAAAARAAARAAAARAAAAAKAAKAARLTSSSGSSTSSSSSPSTSTTTTGGAAGPPAPNGVPPAGTSPIPAGTLTEDFAGIRNCESGDRYDLDTGNGYYGAYQFSAATWQGLGEPGLPSQSAPVVQDAAAYRLYEGSGWGSWPECAALLGLS